MENPLVPEEENWFVTDYIKYEDYYYAVNEAGGRGAKLTDTYIEEKDRGFIIYVDAKGLMVKGKWLDTEEGSFRYVDGSGKVKVNKEGVTAGGYFGDFDEYGYWQERPNEMFDDELEDEARTPVKRFSGDDGIILGTGGDNPKKPTHYYTLIEEDGAWFCYLIPRESNVKDDGTKSVSDVWLGDRYIDKDGKMLTDAEAVKIDGKFYSFDEEGICSLIINSFVMDGEDKIYVGEDGDQVKGDFVPYKDRLIYIGDDGKQVFHEWIPYNGGFRYVNSDGNMVVNSTRVAKGYYGTFDADGYWTAISYEFCDMELSEGNTVRVYAEEGGKILRMNDDGWRCCFESDGQGIRCYQFEEKDGAVAQTKLVTNAWLADLRADGDGYLMTDADSRQIDNRFYSFDEDGHSELMTNTFVTDDDGHEWYVDGDGEKVKGQLVTEGNDVYYFDESGSKVVSQFVKLGEDSFYFGEDGKKQASRFVTVGTDLYYVDDDGKMVTGQFATYGDDTFYFGTDGKKVINQFVEDTSGIYYVGEDGRKLAGQLVTIGSDTYYLDADGRRVSGRFAETVEGTYYFGVDGKKAVSQFVSDETGTYYVDAAGEVLVAEFITIGSDTYYVGDDGKMVTDQFVQDDIDEFYFGTDGKMVKNQFVKDGEDIYYVDADGKKAFGRFVTDATGTYYVGDDGKVAVSQLVTDATGTYYVGADGRVVTNQFATAGPDTFYFGADGRKAVSQFVSDGNGTYYVDADGRKVVSQLVTSENGTYYAGEDGRMAVSQFVSHDGHTLYFGEDGLQAFHRWISVGDKFRYVDGKGHMLADVKKAAGGYYGAFDREGYWTAIEHTFFEDTLGDGTEIAVYSGKEGKIAGIGEQTAGRQQYAFIKDAAGAFHCRLLAVGGEALTEETIANIWMDGVWVNEAGILAGNQHGVEIDQKYYNFDENGRGTLVVNSLIYDKDGAIVCYVGEDGAKVADRFVKVGSHTVYFGTDGKQAFHKWISVGDKFRYVNGKGYMLVNVKKVAGGYYGAFDSEGYWTAIERTFFEDELDDGTAVIKYSGKEGKVAGIGEVMAKRQQYGFLKEADGALRCRLLAEGGGSLTEERVADIWIDDMRVNGDGYLIVAADEPVEGVYYRFDENGHGTLITYEITYVMDGGSNSGANPLSYTGASDPIILETPSKAGYTFDGWYSDRSFSSRVTEIASKSHGDITLYAKWIRNSSSGDNDSDSSSGGSTSSNSSAAESAGTANTGTSMPESVNTGSGAAAVTVTTGNGPNVTVQAGGTVVSATAAQTSEGSVSGNTIISTTETAAIPLSDGQTAAIATIAVGADGSARTLLAAPVQGATVQQTTIVVRGVEVTQNVVVYADGTQVAQKSGAAELDGFADTVVSAEAAIQSGNRTVAEAYNDKVDINLQQYRQVGAAVAYEVTAGVNGAVPQVQMEQTSFAPGLEIAALITDANGNVTAVTIVVGENGIIQYQIPGVNCIVRFMSKA